MNIEPLLEMTSKLLAIVTARLDVNGVLLDANAGFLRLLGDHPTRYRNENVARFFVQPRFTALSGGSPGNDGAEYDGLLTIGDVAGKTRTLRGRVVRTGSKVHVFAEFDIEELERITDTVLDLHREQNASARALVEAHIALKQRDAASLEASLSDALTGVGNRRRLEQSLAAEIARARRNGGALSALMVDLDHFKQVNDRYGHAAGDDVLARFASLLVSHARASDVVARYGGEEFVVLLPHVDLARAAAFGERIRGLLAGLAIDPLPAPITASFGAAELRAEDTGDSLLQRADEALYRAKAGGRNRVDVETPPTIMAGAPT